MPLWHIAYLTIFCIWNRDEKEWLPIRENIDGKEVTMSQFESVTLDS